MIKKCTLLCSLLFIAFTLQSQVLKKAILIGGQLSAAQNKIDYSNNQPDQKAKSGNFAIAAGRAIKDNNLVGINGSYAPSSLTNTYNGNEFVDIKSRTYSVGIFYRHYNKIAKNFYFFQEAGVGYVNTQQRNTSITGVRKLDASTRGGQLTIAPGLAYKLFRHMYAELLVPSMITMQLNRNKIKTATYDAKQTTFSFSSSLSAGSLNMLGLGFRFEL